MELLGSHGLCVTIGTSFVSAHKPQLVKISRKAEYTPVPRTTFEF